MAISPQQLTISLYSAHRAVIFAIAQLSCYVCVCFYVIAFVCCFMGLAAWTNKLKWMNYRIAVRWSDWKMSSSSERKEKRWGKLFHQDNAPAHTSWQAPSDIWTVPSPTVFTRPGPQWHICQQNWSNSWNDEHLSTMRMVSTLTSSGYRLEDRDQEFFHN